MMSSKKIGMGDTLLDPPMIQASAGISRVLRDAIKKNVSSCTILEIGLCGPCVLVVTPVEVEAKWTFTQTVERLEALLDSEQLAECTDITFEYTKKDENCQGSFLAVLAPLLPKIPTFAPRSVYASRQWDSESLETASDLQTPRLGSKFSNFFANRSNRGWMFGLYAFLALAIFGSTFIAYQRAPLDSTLIQYDVGDSLGPKYTSLLTPENITEWAEKHYNPQDWFIRIDDQALIPIELMDEQEWRYQEYLSKRYPEKAELRDSGAWRDPNFLSDPNNYMLPTDMEFHRGHCIRAIRRYWQAKETGHHVCAWDIDYLHLRHCFSMLENVMLPPGPRDESQVMGMSWRAKVCMWEP